MKKAASSSTVAFVTSLLKRRGVRLSLMCAAMLAALAAFSASANAASRFAVNNGNWNATTTWSASSGGASGASVPVAGDDVFIGEGATNRTVTIPTGYSAACASVTMGTLTDNTVATLNFTAASSSLTVSGNLTMNRPNGNANSTIGLATGSLTVNGILELTHHTATSTSTGRVNTITISTGTLAVGGDLIFGAEDATGLQSQIVFSGSGTMNLGGNLTFTNGFGVLTPSTSTVNLNGGGSQTIDGSPQATFNNLTVSNTGGTVTLSANQTVGATLTVKAGAALDLASFNLGTPTSLAMEIGTTGGSITGSTGTLTLGGNVTINATSGSSGASISSKLALGGTRTFTVANDGTSATDLTVSGVVSGVTFGVTKAGAGTMTLSGANTYSGTTTLSAGTLNINNAGSGGTSSAIGTGSCSINGGTIDNTSGGAITLSTNNSVTWGGDFAFTGTNNLNFGTGAVTLGASRTITLNGTSSTLTFGGTVTNTSGASPTLTVNGPGNTLALGALALANSATNRTVTIAGSADVTVTGAVANGSTSNSSLTKDGAGTLILNGAGTYSNQTNVISGTIAIGNNSAFGTSTLNLGGTSSNTPTILASGGARTITNTTLLLQTTLGGNPTISGSNDLTINGSVTNSGGSRTLSISNSGTTTLGGSVFLSEASGTGRTLTINGAGNATISGVIANFNGAGTAGALTYGGSGTLTLTNTNTYTGATSVASGTMNIQNNQGTGTTAGGVTVSSGAALELQGGISVGAEALTLNGDGIGTNGALRSVSGTNTWGGAITLGSDVRVVVAANTLTLSNTIALAGNQLLLAGASGTTGTASNIISSTGTGKLRKDGAGAWTLSGTNTFTGGVLLNSGTLNINNTQALGSTPGTFNIDGAGATNTVTIDNTSGGAITTLDNPITLGTNVIFTGSNNLNLGAGTVTMTASRQITTSAGTLTIGGTLSAAGFDLTKAGAGTLSLGANAVTLTNLNINGGTLDQGSDANITTSGTLTVASGATYKNIGTGDLTVGAGGVSNAGTINFNAHGGSCGDNDDIFIRSDVSGTARTWSGTGTFSMTDVDVKDQTAGTPPATIFVTSGTNNGNNTGWTFLTTCTSGSYVWTGTVSTDWQVAANWSPIRTVPATGDVLIFDGNGTPAPTVTNMPTQEITALRLTNSVNGVTLSASSGATLTLSGGTATDLSIGSGSVLTLNGSNAITMSLTSALGLGTVSGQLTMQGGAHRLLGANASQITFNNGSTFTTASGFTGNPFGTGTNGSVIFSSGSSAYFNDGSDPFGGAGKSIATFNSGSTQTFNKSTAFDSDGRTYGYLNLDGNQTYTGTGSGTMVTFNNLTIVSGSTLDLSLTSGGNLNIFGSFVNNGTFNAHGRTTTFQSSSAQTISGSGAIAFAGLTISNSGAGTTTLNKDASVTGVLTLTTDLKIADDIILTESGTSDAAATGDVIGTVRRTDVGTSAKSFGNVNAQITNGVAGPITVDVTLAKGAPGGFANAVQRVYNIASASSPTTATLRLRYLDSELGSNFESGLTLWRSDGTSIWTDQGFTGRDSSANWVEKSSVGAFSAWTLADGGHVSPTAVRLTSFTATRDGDEVMLQWHTGFEARNLGFNIFREENGQRTRLTPSLVAGTALMTNRGTVLQSGQTYTWYDQTGGQRSGATYWLEDVDLNGTRTLHGPIVPALGDGSPKARQARAEMLNEVAQRTPASGVFFRQWPEALNERQQSTSRATASSSRSTGGSGEAERSDDPESPTLNAPSGLTQLQIEALGGVKIAVSQSGWVRITQPELAAAGLDTNANARKLQLYANGVQIPIKQSGDGTRLTAADFIEFYGHGIDSPTETAQTYYLVAGKDSGLRVGAANPQTLSPPSGAANFNYTVERKERMIYFSGLLNGDAENFFGDIISTDPLTQTVPVTRLDASGAGATLEVTLQGVTSQGHQVRVRINGTDAGTMTFANTAHPKQSFSIPAAAVHEGDNVVELTALGGDQDVSLVDTVRLTYAHSYLADNDSLAIGVNNSNTTRIGGFTNSSIRVVDITDPANVIEMTPAASITSQAGGTFAVDVQVTGATANQPHTLLVFADAQVQHADAVKHNNPSSWANQRLGANYLIVTTGDFMASVEPLAQMRRQQGMSVMVVDVEDLYDEFTFGEHSPRAIQEFLGETTNWKQQPRYVLFAGDATYDPKNYFGQGKTDFVPTKLIDTSLMETASDDWFADFDGDGVADIAIGRLPVRSAADASVMVAKIISYENAAPDPQSGAMMVADNTFEAASSSVQLLLPKAMPAQVINRSSADDATIHNQIIAALNAGPVVANYFGHGSNGVWTGASLLSSPDAATLTNNNRLSLFMMMTCFNGYFQDPYNDSLSEALLKAPGGAVAVWASTSLTEPEGQTVIDQELYRQLFNGSAPRLGDAVRVAKQATNDQDVRRTWTFFGDPAMRLKRAATPASTPKGEDRARTNQ